MWTPFGCRGTPTTSFYPVAPGRPTSTVACLCGVRSGRFGIRWISEMSRNTYAITRQRGPNAGAQRRHFVRCSPLLGRTPVGSLSCRNGLDDAVRRRQRENPGYDRIQRKRADYGTPLRFVREHRSPSSSPQGQGISPETARCQAGSPSPQAAVSHREAWHGGSSSESS